MKTLISICFILLASFVQAQISFSGFWNGVQTTDTTTLRQDQSIEYALTQYKQNVYGYSRNSFIFHDTLFYIVKRIRGTVAANSCELKDDGIIATNFPGRIDKGVRVTTTLTLHVDADYNRQLSGSWKTAKTKSFYSISGAAKIIELPSNEQSKLLDHLKELNLDKEFESIAANRGESTQTSDSTKSIETSIAKPKQAEATNKNVQPSDSAKFIQTSIAKAKQSETTNKNVQPSDSAKFIQTSIAKPKQAAPGNTITQQAGYQPLPAAGAPLVNKTSAKPITPVISNSPILKDSASAKPSLSTIATLSKFTTRQTIVQQEITLLSDSIELSLYDNGEIDGDTVSVYLNGDIILSKQMLRATAVKQKLFLSATNDSSQLTLFADNLGKYPPNTGLLIVKDGDQTYQIRFTATLQQNAAIIFRRKK